MSKPANTRPRRSNSAGRPAFHRESIVDIGQALTELARAKAELEALDTESRYMRHQAELIPLARVDLARRFLRSVLQRHRWRPS